MPSFGLNSEPSCPQCGAECIIGYAHSRFYKWSLRALVCENKEVCGVAYRSMWYSTKLQKMTRFYGSPTLSDVCSRVKGLDFSGAKLFGLAVFKEVDVAQVAVREFLPVEFYSRGWQTTYHHNGVGLDVRLTIEARKPRFKRPHAFQNAIIECGQSRLVVPLSGSWLGTTTDLDVFQNAILSLIVKVLNSIIVDDCKDLASCFSWGSIAGFDKDLMRLVVPLIINRDCHDIWSEDSVDDSLISTKIHNIVVRLKDTFDVFEIEELICQSRVISGKRKFIPRNISMHLCKAFIEVFD